MSATLNNKLRSARNLLQNGDTAAALAICGEILGRAPRNPEALTLRGIAALMGGMPADAARDFRQALDSAPRDGTTLEYLGLALLNLGEFAEAESVLRRASMLAGAPASVWMRLGLAILHQGRAGESVAPLQEAVIRAPDDPDCRLSLGRGLAATGSSSAARAQFAAVLQAVPGHPDALFNLGVLQFDAGDLDAARRHYSDALAHDPWHVEALINLAVVLEQQQHAEEAVSRLEQALVIAPGNPHAHSGLGRIRLARGQTSAARHHFAAALAAAPTLAVALEGMGTTARMSGRHGEAARCYGQLVAQDAGDAAAWGYLAHSLLQIGKLEEAEAAARRALQIDPLHARAHGALALRHIVRGELDAAVAVLEQGVEKTGDAALLGLLTQQARHLCDWPRWRNAWARLAPLVTASPADCGCPFPLLGEDLTAAQLLDYTRRWAHQRFGAPAVRAASVAAAHGAAQVPHRPVRIGYFSSDFQEHPAAYLLTEMFELHDRERFEIYAYSYGPADDGAMRRRIRAAVDHFIDVAWDPDDTIVERIRDDCIDILIDLKGYTVGDRLEVMAQRPSPVQITWLGYPGTTGAGFIDYLIADPFILPVGEETGCSEQVLRMPHCYQPIDRKRAVDQPLSRAEYGLPDSGFVFCCFNQTFKITPDLFAAWLRMLAAVPDSVLWLVEANRWATANLRREAAAAGIAPARLVFAPRLPLARHLARYRVADLALDTFPYTSHTTASDALWCGCPLLALCGTTFPARVSGSILNACGLEDLVSSSLPEYEHKGLALALHPEALQSARNRLAATLVSAPFFDTTLFTRDLETLLLGLVRR